MNADIHIVDDPAQEAAELLAAASGHVALTGGSTPRVAYESAPRAARGLVRGGLLVHRRALRAARPRALELRHGRARAPVEGEGATVHRMQGELGPTTGRTPTSASWTSSAPRRST